MSKNCRGTITPLLYFLVSLFLAVPQSMAASNVTARYQSVKDNSVVFIVEVGSPAPANLIVSHSHPAANRLVSASPAATKINHQAGISKWLLRSVKPGVYPFSLHFKNPVQARALRLTVSHRNPASGSIKEFVVRP